jgi:hypothetical protein
MVVGFTTAYESVPITTYVVNSNHADGEVSSIQHYVRKLPVTCEFGGFIRVLWFPPPIKLTNDITEILLKVTLNIIPPYKKDFLYTEKNQIRVQLHG